MKTTGSHRRFILMLCIGFLNTTGCSGEQDTRVMLGSEVLIAERLDLLEGKNVGLITNHTGRLPDGRTFAEALMQNGVRLTALLAPEHGFFGTHAAGEMAQDQNDPLTGIPVYSLYGKTQKPTPEMLRGIDLLLYDIQDVGVRFYTYISTMGLAMEAAAEAGIPFVVLDRPNPQGGVRVEGPMMDDSLRSFVGLFPIPVLYGLTCGELALMIAGEGWLRNGVKPEVSVVPMSGWTRAMLWEATGLVWTAPSPNIPNPETALAYAATCYLEATQLSEGRGTKEPFRLIGAPFVDSSLLKAALDVHRLTGVEITPVSFIPSSSKHQGSECRGIRLRITDNDVFRPSATGLALLTELVRHYTPEAAIRRDGLERLIGSRVLVARLLGGGELTETAPILDDGLEEFRKGSEPYHLYR